MSDISKIKVNDTTYTLKDSRIPTMPNDSSKVLKGNGTWGKESSPYVSGTGSGSAVLSSVTATTNAVGTCSVAEGSNVMARSDYAHAEGNYTTAGGQSSHSEGYASSAIGLYSHSEGGGHGATTFTKLSGSGTTYTVGDPSKLSDTLVGKHIVVDSVRTYILSVDIANSTLRVKDTLGELSSSDARIWYNPSSVGAGSHAEGYDATAYGQNSHAEGRGTISTGTQSHSEGSNTRAEGLSSHAEGLRVVSYGQYSHAEGDCTTAYGQSSHAEGSNGNSSYTTIKLTGSGTTYTPSIQIQYRHLKCNITYRSLTATISAIDYNNNTLTVTESLGTLNSASCKLTNRVVAYGTASHAEGVNCGSYGPRSHAEGENTSTYGTASHAEGYNTLSFGDDSHAEGGSARAFGLCSHAEGSNTLAYGSNSHAEGGYTGSDGGTITLTGSGTTYTASYVKNYFIGSLVSYNNSKSFITNVNFNNKTVTLNNTLGELNAASCTLTHITSSNGQGSHAEGCGASSIGSHSHAEGYHTASKAEYSHAEGQFTETLGDVSHAEGQNTIASGSASHAEGYQSRTIGNYSHSEGWGGQNATVVLTGSGTTYSTNVRLEYCDVGQSISYGNVETYITGVDPVNKTVTVKSTLGELSSAACSYFISTSAGGSGSHAEGYQTSAYGGSAHSEGYRAAATTQYSHAEGYQCTTRGPYAHAEGYYTIAKGTASHAEGSYTIATTDYSHVAGKYNVEDLNNTYAEIIGIGSTESSRKNGRTLDWSGNEQLAGSLTLGLGATDETTLTAAQLKQLIALLSGGGMVINTSETTINSHTYLQMDKTFAQIVEAYKSGQTVLVFFGNETTTYCYYPIEGIYCDTTFESDSQNIIVKGNYFKPTGQSLNSYPICYNTDYYNW